MRTRHSYSDEEIADVIRLREEGLIFADIGARLGLTGDQARGVYKRHHAEYELSAEAGTPIPTVLQEWKSHDDRPTWEELLNYAQQGANLQHRLRPVNTRVKRVIETDRDIFVVHMSDFHLGAPTTDYELFMRTTDFILNNDQIFVIVVGSDLEFAIKQFRDASAVLNQVMPPWMQLEAYRLWLEEMLPKCLLINGDNHVDARMDRFFGSFDLNLPDGIPVCPGYAILKLFLDNGKNTVKYMAVTAHQFRGSSIYHDLQPTFRLFRDVHPLADWYVTAHRHTPAYMEGVFFQEARLLKPVQRFLVCGTFKTGADLYLLREFGSKGILGLPTLRLSAKEWGIQYYPSPQVALGNG